MVSKNMTGTASLLQIVIRTLLHRENCIFLTSLCLDFSNITLFGKLDFYAVKDNYLLL